MADRVPRKLKYREAPVEKTWPDREDLSEAELQARAAGYPEEPSDEKPPSDGDEEG